MISFDSVFRCSCCKEIVEAGEARANVIMMLTDEDALERVKYERIEYHICPKCFHVLTKYLRSEIPHAFQSGLNSQKGC